MAKVLQAATLLGEPMKGSNHSNSFVEMSEVQDLVSSWEYRGSILEKKIDNLERTSVDTSSCVPKGNFETVKTQISSLFKVLMSKQGEMLKAITELNKMIIEVNNKLGHTMDAEKMGSRQETSNRKFATMGPTAPPNELDELLKMAHKDSAWTKGKRKSSDSSCKSDTLENANRIKHLEDDVVKLIKFVEHVLHKEESKAVDIGGTSFGGEDDVEVLVEKNLPPSTPFGCFVDIYSFLN